MFCEKRPLEEVVVRFTKTNFNAGLEPEQFIPAETTANKSVAVVKSEARELPNCELQEVKHGSDPDTVRAAIARYEARSLGHGIMYMLDHELIIEEKLEKRRM